MNPTANTTHAPDAIRVLNKLARRGHRWRVRVSKAKKDERRPEAVDQHEEAENE